MEVPSPIKPKTENRGDSPAAALAAAGTKAAPMAAAPAERASRREDSCDRKIEGEQGHKQQVRSLLKRKSIGRDWSNAKSNEISLEGAREREDSAGSMLPASS